MDNSKLEKNKKIISDLLQQVGKIKNDVLVSLVTNVKGLTDEFNDFDKHSVSTEFLSENELEEINGSLKSFGFYTEIFFDETKFMSAVLNKEYNLIKKKYCIIYNTSQKGTGPGRKSLIPAFCNLHNLLTTSSNAYVVSLCRHKFHYNSILKKLGLPVAESWFYDSHFGWLLNQKPSEGKLILAKPTFESASIGLDNNSIMPVDKYLDESLKKISQEYRQPITVQEFIEGFEIEIPVININPIYSFFPIGISLNNEKNLGKNILTYNTVYNDDYAFYEFDNFSKKEEQNILRCAENVIMSLGISGFGRVDFRVTNKNKFYITDIATNPHITKHSSFAFLFNKLKFSYKELPAFLIATALKSNDNF